MLLAYSRRSDRGEHAVLHYPNAGWRLTKKDRGRFLLLIWGAGVSEKLNVQFSFQPPSPPPPLFISLRHRGKVNLLLRTIFLFTEKSKKSLGAPEPFLLVQIVGLMINGIKLNSV